jgi:quinol monooxygenase YgiN
MQNSDREKDDDRSCGDHQGEGRARRGIREGGGRIGEEGQRQRAGLLALCAVQGQEPNTYAFIERYKDQAAIEAHRATDHYKTLGRAMGAFMDGRAEVKRFQQVAG